MDSLNKDAYYSRQIVLPEIGNSGQQSLEQSKILVIGAGGLGSAALMYLAAAGVGTIGISDFDQVEVSNLHRQVIYKVSDIGHNKSEAAIKRLTQVNPFIKFNPYPCRLERLELQEIISTYHLVIDCTDNYTSKYLLNDICVSTQKPLIQSSVHRWEGQILAILPNAPGGCLRCIWPQQPEPNCMGSCTEDGVIGVVPGLFGILQATEALKILLGLPTPLANNLLTLNLIGFQTNLIKRHKSPFCTTCNTTTTTFTTKSFQEQSTNELDVARCTAEQLQGFIAVDIRELPEIDAYPAPCHLIMPLSQFDLSRLDPQKKYLFFCQKGIRSYKLVSQLQASGFKQVYSAIGGAKALIGTGFAATQRELV